MPKKATKNENLEKGLTKLADVNATAQPDKLTPAIQKRLNELLKTKGGISAAIRYLDTERFTHSQIAKVLGKRHQHVRNVLTTELKRPAK